MGRAAQDGPTDDEIARATTFLTAEHSALQTARSATIFEANGRVSLYLGALSGAVVALAFIGQATGLETAFFAFGAAVLLTVLAIGVVTFVRVQQTAIEDVGYAIRTDRLRHFYVRYSPLAAQYLDPPQAEDDPDAHGMLGYRPARWQTLLTTAGMVAVVNGAVAAGALAAIAALLGGRSLPVGLLVGAVTFVTSGALHYRYLSSTWQAAMAEFGDTSWPVVRRRLDRRKSSIANP